MPNGIVRSSQLKLPVAQKKKRKIIHDHESNEKKINQIIKEKDFKVSIAEIARRLKVSKGYLYYRFPDEVKIITSRHRYFRKKKGTSWLSVRIQKVKLAVADLVNSAVYPSRRKVFQIKYGLKPTDYIAPEIIQAWRDEVKRHKLTS
jgi:AraC-like DNA-binding protein